MNVDIVSRWAIGIIAGVIWCFGAKAGLPDAVISLAATIVPGLVGHTLAKE